MTAGTELEYQLLGFAPVGDEHVYCISSGVSVPDMSVYILQQIVSEASAKAKDPMPNV